MKSLRQRRSFKTAAALIIPAVLCICVVMIVASAISNAGRVAASENAVIIEQGVRRAASSCYAAEGFYPDDIEYLVTNYALSVDSEHYIIHYSPISSNILPEIRVIAKQ